VGELEKIVPFCKNFSKPRYMSQVLTQFHLPLSSSSGPFLQYTNHPIGYSTLCRHEGLDAKKKKKARSKKNSFS
jgi:hypothetical protein